MSMQFDEAMNEKSLAKMKEAFDEMLVVSDEKTALFGNLTEDKQKEFEAFQMTKYKERVHWICCTSVDDARTSIQNETDLNVLDLCLNYEKQHSNRTTMIRMLKSRINKIEKE